MLAKYYECALLTVDSIITEAIANGKSVASVKARQACREIATKHAEDQKVLDAINQNGTSGIGAVGGVSNSTGATGLSAEALAQHSLIRK